MSQPSPSVSSPAWTLEAVALLRRCVGDGTTSLEAARRLSRTFGAALSKSAVIGKASRLGLRFGRGEGGHALVRVPKKKPGGGGQEGGGSAAPSRPLERGHAQVHVPGLGWSLAERLEGCRWPLGEPPPGEAWRQQFCCEATPAGQSWCETHQVLGRVPTTQSQKKAIEALADWAIKRDGVRAERRA